MKNTLIKIAVISFTLGIILGGALLMTQNTSDDCPGGCVHYFRMK